MNTTVKQVALLVSDLSDAKILTDVFKSESIHPCFYQSYGELMEALSKESFDLLIVDVRLTSSGDQCLQNHPKVANGELVLALFVTPACRPLLTTATSLFHWGILDSSQDLHKEVKALLMKVDLYVQRDLQNKRLSRLLAQTEFRLKEEQEKFAQRHQMKNAESAYERLESRLSSLRFDSNFTASLVELFAHERSVDRFTVLTLDHEQKRVVTAKAPILGSFISVPPIYLGRKCETGIPPFAQEAMAHLLHQHLGENVMLMQIRGMSVDPDYIVAITTSADLLSHFPWNALEKEINILYLKSLLKEGKVVTDHGARLLHPWQMMSVMDHLFSKDTTSLDYELVDIDFKSLLDEIESDSINKFAWSKFFHDFIAGLELTTKVDFKLCTMGLRHIGVMIPRAIVDSFFKELKYYSTRFNYWRYFQDGEVTFTKNLTPKLRMIPFSDQAYLRYLEKGEIVYARSVDEKRTSVIPPSALLAERKRDLSNLTM